MRIRVLLCVALVGTIRTVSAQRAQPRDTLHCFSCHPQARPVRALGELFIVQLIPFAVNNVIRDKEWAPGSWSVRFEIKAATGKIDVTLETP